MKQVQNLDDQNIITFNSEDGQISFDVTLDKETVWLSQKQIAELFDKNVMTVNEHIKNIYLEEELEKISTIRDFLIVQKEGNRTVKRNIEHYSLDVIISTGYRVKSKRGTQFRQWATGILKDHLIQGYTVNTKRLLEQKIELEIRESSKVVAHVLLMKGIGTSTDSQEVIDTVSTYLGKTQDQETMILKAHILIERFMVQFLKKQGKNKHVLDSGRFTYRHLLSLSQFHHEPEEKRWLWELLGRLNEIRNKFAHTLDSDAVEKEMKEFIRICIAHFGKEKILLDKETRNLKTVLVHLCGTVYGSFS